MVVDDEQLVRLAARATLTKLGYQVVTAASGEEAVELLRAGEARPDLVLIDMIMPGIDGAECLHRLRAVDPTIRALVISGYAPDGAVQEMIESGALGFLQKPFSVETLGRAVRDALKPGG